MSRRKNKSSFDMLGGALYRKGRNRRKKNRGLLAASGFGKRKRGGGGLAGAAGLGERLFSSRSKGAMRDLRNSLRERLTPTERAEIADQAEQELTRQQQAFLDADLAATQSDRWTNRNRSILSITPNSRIIELLRNIISRMRNRDNSIFGK